MLASRRRWRLFRPWIEKPCSRVLRKLSGELAAIRDWAAGWPPDLRWRRERPREGRCCSSLEAGSACSSESDTSRRLLAVHAGRGDRAQVARLWKEGAQVAELADVAHLVPGHQAADLEQARLAAARVGDRPVPRGLGPAVEKGHPPAPDPRQVLA